MENGGRNAAATFFREPVCGEESSKEAFCFPIMKPASRCFPADYLQTFTLLRIIQYKDGTHIQMDTRRGTFRFFILVVVVVERQG